MLAVRLTGPLSLCFARRCVLTPLTALAGSGVGAPARVGEAHMGCGVCLAPAAFASSRIYTWLHRSVLEWADRLLLLTGVPVHSFIHVWSPQRAVHASSFFTTYLHFVISELAWARVLPPNLAVAFQPPGQSSLPLRLTGRAALRRASVQPMLQRCAPV